MVATPTAQATTVPTFGVNVLRATLADLQAQEPERGSRWHRAAMIVALRRIEPGYTSGWYVESESEPGKEYWVLESLPGVWTCTCQDYQRRGGPCKHAVSVMMLQECERREQGPEPPPIALPFGEANPDAPIAYALTDQALALLERVPAA